MLEKQRVSGALSGEQLGTMGANHSALGLAGKTNVHGNTRPWAWAWEAFGAASVWAEARRGSTLILVCVQTRLALQMSWRS